MCISVTQQSHNVLPGLSGACAILSAQAYGSGNPKLASLILLRGIIISFLIMIPVGGLMLGAGVFARVSGATEEVADLAFKYAAIMCISLPSNAFTSCMGAYMCARDTSMPQLVGAVFSVIVNIPANWFFIWKLGLGFEGSPLATSTTVYLGLVFIVVYFFRTCEGGWRSVVEGWDMGKVFQRDGIKTYFYLGVPEAFGTMVEELGFNALMVLAATLPNSTHAISATTVMVSIYSIPYFFFFGIAQAAAARVGNYLGNQDIPSAKRATWASFVLAAFPLIVFVPVCLAAGNSVGAIYTDDTNVQDLVGSGLRIVAVALVFDGCFTVCTCGVLSGMGNTMVTAACRLVMLIVVVPASWYLGVYRSGDMHDHVDGLWWGWVIAVAVCTTVAIAAAWKVDWEKAMQLAQDRMEEEEEEEEEEQSIKQTNEDNQQS